MNIDVNTLRDEQPSKKNKTHTMLFRVYPVPSYTGVIANAPFQRAVGIKVYDHIKKYYANKNYRIGAFMERYGKCPEGYSCKYFELPVYFKTARMNETIVWINNDD